MSNFQNQGNQTNEEFDLLSSTAEAYRRWGFAVHSDENAKFSKDFDSIAGIETGKSYPEVEK